MEAMSDVYVVTMETYNEGGSVLGISDTLEGAQTIGQGEAKGKQIHWRQIHWERERWESSESDGPIAGANYLAIERFPLDRHEPTEGKE
jgi:hypothetical protein